MPRYVVLVKGGADYEAGRLPSEQELSEMGAYNEKLVDAGMMLSGEGLHPSSRGALIRYDKGKTTVIDGPFAEAKELVAGFWILQARSLEETIDWMKRAPFQEGEVEIREIHGADDFGEAFTPELREQEERLRARLAEQTGKNQ